MANIINGTTGNDVITGTTGDDVINGDAGNDRINGGAGNDIIYGGQGTDTLTGDAGNDILYGGDGNDGFFGGGNDDTLYGEAGDDVMYGDGGNDSLFGGDGNDTLNGGTGDDRMDGGAGINTLNGGAGVDTVVINITSAALTDAVRADLDLLVRYMDDQLATAGSIANLAAQTTGSSITLSSLGLTLNTFEAFEIYVDGVLTPISDILNNAPIADAEVMADGTEDVAISGTIDAYDPDDDIITFSMAADPVHGSVVLDSQTGAYTYTPNANFNGVDTFTVDVTDDLGATTSQTVTVNVAAVNDAPVAADASAATNEDNAVSGQLTATDVDGDALTWALANGPAHGTVTVDANGAYTYTPAANFNGADSFQVSVTDAAGASVMQTVNVAVAAVNDAPVAADASAATNEDNAVSGQLTATDVDGDALTWALANGPAHGTVTVAANGAYTYTPAANFNGADSFQVAVTDAAGASVMQTVNVAVAAVNDAPVAADASAATNEDNAVSGQLVASDADGDALTWALANGPAHGTVTVDANGAYTYTPAANFNGADSFQVAVTDAAGASVMQTVNVAVAAVNDAPVADAAVAAATNEDNAVSGQLTATDVDGDALTWALANGPAHGTVTVNANGAYTYTPAANFNGADSFQVSVTDAAGASVMQTVNVAVAAVNDAPVAADASAATNEDNAVSGQLTATDVDGDALTWALANGPAHGTVTVDANGAYTYTPAANFNGADSFQVAVTDAAGASVMQTVNVAVAAVNDAPVAADASAATNEDNAVSGQLVASDADGDALTWALTNGPAHGTVTVDANGAYTYTPAANFNGADSFQVSVTDAAGASVMQTVNVAVAAVNDAPVAADASAATNEDNAVSGQLVASDADGDALTWALTNGPAHGTVTVNANGAYTYTPASNFNGADSFQVAVTDAAGASVMQTVNVAVAAVNDAPVAADALAATNEDNAVSGQLVASDADGDALTWALANGPAHGTVTVDANGAYTYTPAANFNGADSFQVAVTDAAGASVMQTVNVAVAAVNDAPVAADASAATNEDNAVSGQLAATDVDGDALTWALANGPAHGTVTVDANGAYTYTPAANFNGADSFQVSVTDAAGASVMQTVNVAVAAVNDAPVAADASAATNEDNAVSGQLVASDADGDALTWALANGPAHGTVTVDANGAYTYTPAANFNGADSFQVAVTDAAGASVMQTVNVAVAAVNDAPVADAVVSASAVEDTSFNAQLVASDIDSESLTWALETGASHGSVFVSEDGEYTYTADADYNGADSFQVSVTDTSGARVFQTVNVDVAAVNDAPVADAEVFAATNEDNAVTGQLAATDVDGDALTWALANGPAHGTVTVDANGAYTYTPATNFNGADSFEVSVTDAAGESVTQLVSVTVAAVNDAPVAAANVSVLTDEDAAVSGQLTASDVDGDALTWSVVNGPAHGALTLDASGAYTYTPGSNFNGSDSFQVAVADASGATALQTVNVGVNGVNNAPVADATVAAATNEDAAISGQLTATDVDGDVLTWSVTTGPAHGTLTLAANGAYTYTPAADFNGADSFEVKVADTSGAFTTQTVNVAVAAVNDAPVADEGVSETTEEDVAITGQLVASDVDGDALTWALTNGPAHGTVTVDANGAYTYTPAANYTGADSFQVAVTDTAGATVVQTVGVSVTAVNDAPVADAAAAAATNEDASIAGQLVASDADGDTLTWALTNGPAHGTVTVDANGAYTYTPAANFNGADSFQVAVTDAAGASVMQTVNVAVAAVNDAPVAADASAATNEDNAVSGQLTATDVDGDALSWALTNGPAHGTVTVDANGAYTYTPAANFNGADSFQVAVTDAAGASVMQTVNVAVAAVNDAPVAADASAATNEDNAVSGQLVASDADGDALTWALTNGPAHGTVTVDANGAYTYTPAANFNGADSFQVAVTDAAGASVMQTVNVAVAAVNDAPVADAAVAAATNEDTTVIGQLTATDVDGDALSWALTNGPAHGTVTVDANGAYTYAPAANFNGADSFQVAVTDAAGASALQTVTVTVNGVNNAPVADATVAAATNEDTAITGQLTATDVDGDALTWSVANGPAHGTLTLAANGAYTYTPAANFNGADSFQVKVADTSGAFTTQTVNVAVAAVNDAPVAAANVSAAGNEDTAITGQLTATDVDGDALTWSVANGPAHGMLTLAANGAYTYTPAANFNGADSFQVKVADASGAFTTQTVNVAVAAVNDAPVAAANVSAAGNEDTAITGQLTATDVDGDALTWSVANGPAHGTLTLAANGAYTYTPAANFNGADSFQVKIADASGAFTTQTVNVAVAAVNDAPVAAANVSAAGNEDTAITGQLTATDVDGDALTWSVANGPAHGTLTLAANGAYTYTAAANYAGTDTVRLTVRDASGASATQTLNIAVAAVADAPTVAATATPLDTAGVTLTGTSGNDLLRGGAGNDVISGGAGNDIIIGNTGGTTSTQNGYAASLAVSAALTDLDGSETLSLKVTGMPANATLSAGSLNSDGSWSLTPAQLSGLTVSSATAQTFKLTIVATATEAAGGTASASTSVDVVLNATTAGSDADTLSGGAGNDIIYAGNGNNTLSDGEGSDYVYGAGGNDLFIAGTGSDIYSGGSGFDTLDVSAATGDMTVDLRYGYSQGSLGTDLLASIEGVIGSNYSDEITGSAAANTLSGGAGDDQISGGAGNDTIYGGTGKDQLYGDDGDDVIYDGAGDDKVYGGDGDDTVYAGSGKDTYYGGDGFDTLDYSAATNAIAVDLSRKEVTGGDNDKVDGFEKVIGTAFNDSFLGSRGADVFVGGAGNDTFRGQGGSDTFTGGAGSDTFEWLANDVMQGRNYLGADTITDFGAGDKLNIDDLVSGNVALQSVVHVTDSAAGTMVSVKLNGSFVDVVLLQDVHNLTLSTLAANGQLLA